MKVFKFGGASVRSAEGLKNLGDIVAGEAGKLFLVVSAMGKTTNALEGVVDAFASGDKAQAAARLENIESYHRETASEAGAGFAKAEALFSELRGVLTEGCFAESDYDLWYDRIVSFGELVSTTLVAEYLLSRGLPTCWIDARRCIATDLRHRDANIDLKISEPLLRAGIEAHGADIFISQGFIGAAPDDSTTTLGREGSDYSAAAIASMLDCESVTIWKDVEGVLNSDPKMFDNAVHIPELTYLDAIELAYSGAQIIHPKTIKPLQNRGISLYVRPFGDRTKAGSVIRGEISAPISVPVLILKRGQVLLSIRPRDFSFVLEERTGGIISLFESHRVKINLIQSSAVNLTLCVDDSRALRPVIRQLCGEYRVVYNENMELLTVRGYNAGLKKRYESGSGVYLTQSTRKILRIVRKSTAI